jgi:hypothetical protein
MTRVPAAFAAPLAEAMDQIFLDVAAAIVDAAIFSAFKHLSPTVELTGAMTLLRAVCLLRQGYDLTADGARPAFAILLKTRVRASQ